MSPETGSNVLRAIFSGASKRPDRLPTLQTAFERAATTCADQLRDTTVPPPEVMLQQLESGTAAEMLSQHDGNSVAAVLIAEQWNARLLVSADRACVFALVEMLLGGDGSQPPQAPERDFSRLETNVVGTFFDRLAAALEAAFEPLAKSSFVVESVEDRIEFDAIGRRNSSVVVARLALRVWSHEGEILIVIPSSAIEPMRQVFGQEVSEEAVRSDPGWTNQIQEKITRTSVVLSAVLDERSATLQEIADLHVGQIFPLNATAQSLVRVECNGEPLLWCQLGKSNGAYMLRVDGPIDRDQEFMNDLLGG
jgi:flagellar motor switch protein FliM